MSSTPPETTAPLMLPNREALSISLDPAVPSTAPKPAAPKPTVPSTALEPAALDPAVTSTSTITRQWERQFRCQRKRRARDGKWNPKTKRGNQLCFLGRQRSQEPTPVTYGPSSHTHPCADEPTLRVVVMSAHVPTPLLGCTFKQQVNPSTRTQQFGDLKGNLKGKLKGKELYEKGKDLPAWQQAQELGCWIELNAIAVSYIHSIEGMATESKKGVADADLPIAHQFRMMGFSEDLASRCHRTVFYRFMDDMARALDFLRSHSPGSRFPPMNGTLTERTIQINGPIDCSYTSDRRADPKRHSKSSSEISCICSITWPRPGVRMRHCNHGTLPRSNSHGAGCDADLALFSPRLPRSKALESWAKNHRRQSRSAGCYQLLHELLFPNLMDCSISIQ